MWRRGGVPFLRAVWGVHGNFPTIMWSGRSLPERTVLRSLTVMMERAADLLTGCFTVAAGYELAAGEWFWGVVLAALASLVVILNVLTRDATAETPPIEEPPAHRTLRDVDLRWPDS